MKLEAKLEFQVCQVVASINKDTGGAAESVVNLTEHLADHFCASHLLTLDYPWLGTQLAVSKGILHTYPATFLSKHFRGFQPQLHMALQQLAANQLDLIHNHGIWMLPNIYARQAAKLHDLPLIISPRGALDPWLLKRGRFKKWLAWRLYEQENLSSATAFHATSVLELNSIRQLGFKQPIALIPDGVNLPNLDLMPDRKLLSQDFPALGDKRWLLFLSRLHPKKGIDVLLQAWKKLAPAFADWQLVIAGPDLTGYQSYLNALTVELELQHSVTFTGMLTGQHKSAALHHADLFVLPTHSENFGIAVAESLAHGVPVVTTKAAPWQDLVDYNCGWWIEDEQRALETTLVEAMQLSPQDRQAMGTNGRNLVASKYSWSKIGSEMSKLYYQLLQ